MNIHESTLSTPIGFLESRHHTETKHLPEKNELVMCSMFRHGVLQSRQNNDSICIANGQLQLTDVIYFRKLYFAINTALFTRHLNMALFVV